MSKTIEIDQDTGHCADSPHFLGYDLVTRGTTLWELVERAYIVEVDQEGEEHDSIPLSDMPDEVIRTCETIIAEKFLKSLT